MQIRKVITKLFILFITTMGMAQSKTSLKLETQGGYEYNYFRSPEEIRSDGQLLTKEGLIASSTYQDVSGIFRYRYKWGKNRLRFLGNPFSRIFYENIDDSYWSLNTTVKYDHKISKSLILLAEARFKRMNREGLGGDQNVLINPLGYTNYGASGGVEFVPFTANEMTLKGFYNFKDFDAFGVRDLQFNEFGIQFSTVQSFTVDRQEHQIGLTAYVKKREYDTFNASEIDTDGERDWDYVKATLFYELPIGNRFKISPDLMYYKRIDNSTDRSGFDQYGPGVTMAFKSKLTRIRSSFSFITRNYDVIEARNTEELIGEKLKYEYANFGLDITHKIGNGFSISGTVFSRIRSTNYTDIDARSFRNYRNQYAGIGILWEL